MWDPDLLCFDLREAHQKPARALRWGVAFLKHYTHCRRGCYLIDVQTPVPLTTPPSKTVWDPNNKKCRHPSPFPCPTNPVGLSPTPCMRESVRATTDHDHHRRTICANI